MSTAEKTATFGAGLVGALAFAFTDTFWFSAVEAEVYALSSLCTAIVFWAVLKWEANGADKWLVFIAYIMGLSIGIHLLNLLVIPAISVIYYFRSTEKTTVKGACQALAAGCILLLIVQFGIIQYTVKGAAYFDLFFVNNMGLPFGSGVLVFLLLIAASVVLGIRLSIRRKNYKLNLALICFSFILLGYSSYLSLPIRASAKPNLNNSDVDNAFSLNGYLNREQFPTAPLAYGQYFDSQIIDQKKGKTFYRKGDKQYEPAGKKMDYVYDRNTLFPRIFADADDAKQFYTGWAQLAEGQQPTFLTNLGFLFSWQINQMYVRYFLWNFAGRYNDADGQSGSGLDGGWTAGFTSKKDLPKTVSESKAYNRLFCLPLVLGILGVVFHFRHDRKYAGVVSLLFFFTGLAIVLYLNQDPPQPRERDYAYVGSFYAFAIWIGLGVLAVFEGIKKVIHLRAQTLAFASTAICLLTVPVWMAVQEWDDHDRSQKTVAHDMAINLLQSCRPNAILFTNGDNDTFPLWYVQEVENIRPDVRIVILTLAQSEWFIRGMKQKMNTSEPLPITMPVSKFKEGVRDILPYSDAGIKQPVAVKEVFDFLMSDDEAAKVQFEDGTATNYLPTKNLKLPINKRDIIKNKVVSDGQYNRIDTALVWSYPKNYLTKDGLMLLDILAHNNWKRPVYFAVTVGNNVFGLQNYLYNEGLAYHLMPLKNDTAIAAFSKTNSQVMYNNVMKRFKWGNFKRAPYLDHESTTMFYPVLLNWFNTLAENLAREGKTEQAVNVLKKYESEMPDLNPYLDITVRKFYLADTCYRLKQTGQANRIIKGINNYLGDELRYIAQKNPGERSADSRDVQLGLYVMDEMVKLTMANKQTGLHDMLALNLKNIRYKFGLPIQ